MKTLFEIISSIIAFVVFVGSWIYCINEYGYLFGVGLGWLPSIIVATLAYWLWLPALIIIEIIILIQEG